MGKLLEDSNLVKPCGDLARDLEEHNRVLLRRGTTCSEVRAVGAPEDREMVFVASTGGIKRDGNKVDCSGFMFDNFEKNPVMLWAHDYGSEGRPPLPPIGHWVEWAVEGSGDESRLIMRGKFAEHEFADTIHKLYAAGSLRAVSIGWTPLEYEPITDDSGAEIGSNLAERLQD